MYDCSRVCLSRLRNELDLNQLRWECAHLRFHVRVVGDPSAVVKRSSTDHMPEVIVAQLADPFTSLNSVIVRLPSDVDAHISRPTPSPPSLRSSIARSASTTGSPTRSAQPKAMDTLNPWMRPCSASTREPGLHHLASVC